MDHLKSSQERKDRWYATNVSPKHIPTVPADLWEDLWETNNSYASVKTLPFEWLDQPASISRDEQICQKMIKAMEIHGFLIVSGVMDKGGCDQAMDAAWDWIEAASDAERQLNNSFERQCEEKEVTTPVQRQDLSTLSSIYFPRSVEGGIMPFYGSGHSKFAWTVRSNKNVKRVFDCLHNDNNLLSSLDGIVIWRSGSKASLSDKKE